MRPEEGMRIGGRYLLHARIAAGGMGEVWRAVDDVLGRTVAVKTLKPGLSDDSEFVQRFRAEARNAARLANGHIAQLHDYGEGDGIAFLVMEFVDGQPLSRIITDRAPLPVPQVVDLLAQCCDALGDAHTEGIVHRDVKPANIVVTGSGTAKLTDFGIARAADNSSLTQAGEVMGTPMYLAPEAAMGQEATGRSDLYSLAVVAYQMLTGRLPFHADTPIGYAMAHVNQPPDPLPASLPHGIRDAVSSALAKRPEERPASMAAFASMLRAVVPPGVATVVTPTVGPPDPDPAQGPEAETVRAPLPGTSTGASEEQPVPSAAPTVTEERCPPAVEPLRVGANAVLHGTALQVHLEAVEPLDLLAFELDSTGRVLADASFVFYNQPQSPTGAVRLASSRLIEVDTTRIPAEAVAVVVGAASPDDRPVAADESLQVVLADGERRHEIRADHLTDERAVVLLRIYRRGGGWKVRNLVSGWEGGLRAMVEAFGVRTAD